MTSDDRQHDLDQRPAEGVDRAPDQLGAVVNRDDRHAGGSPPSIARSFSLTRAITSNAFSPCRMMTIPETASPRPSRSAAPRRKSGPIATSATSLTRIGVPLFGRRQHDVLEIGARAEVAVAAHHVLGAAEFDHAPADLAVAAAHGLHDLADGEAVGAQPVGIDVHLVLADVAAERRDVGDAGDRLQVSSGDTSPAAIAGRRGCASRVVHEHVLEHPAEAGRVGSELGRDALRQARKDRREVLERPRARPVDIGAVVEDDVDERVAEVRDAAHRLDVRRADERRDDRRGDLVLDQVRAAIPARVDDHLRVAEVGDRVERHALQRPPAGGGGGERDEDDRGRDGPRTTR